MNAVIEVRHLTKTYKKTKALDDVSLTIEQDAIYGLLGRNGAGKTTLMSILTAQDFATSGDIDVFGEHPYENARVLNRMCFVRGEPEIPGGCDRQARTCQCPALLPALGPVVRRGARR